MSTDLKSLLLLQEKDLTVMSVEKELEELQPEVDELDEQLQQLETARDASARKLEEAKKWRDDLEAKIEGYRVMQERKRQKLEFVRGAKEASSIMAELDLARTVLAKEEAEWLRSEDLVNQAEKAMQEADEALNSAKEEQAPKREEIEKRRSALEKRLQEAEKVRDDAKSSIGERNLAKYERVLRGSANQALYELHGEACGRCFTTVPKQYLQILEQGKQLITCEGCGVILYPPAPSEE